MSEEQKEEMINRKIAAELVFKRYIFERNLSGAAIIGVFLLFGLSNIKPWLGYIPLFAIVVSLGWVLAKSAKQAEYLQKKYGL